MMDFVIMRRGKGDIMVDAISRKDAINALEQGFKDATNGLDKSSPTRELIKAVTGIYKCYIEELQPIQPEPKKGKWIYSSYDDEYGFDESWECDKCGYTTNIEETNFCPNCGADMREGQHEHK